MTKKNFKRFASTKTKRKRGNAKLTVPKTKKSEKRAYKYEDHAIKRASKELFPCDKKRHQKIVLRDYTDSKGVFHKADIPFRSLSNIASNGKIRKQNNYRIVEWDFVNRDLGVVIEVDGIGHYSSHVFGGSSFVTGRENDLIKEDYCKAKGWIMVRVSNLCSRDPTKCCGIPEFNRRLERKFEKVRRMLGSRAPPKTPAQIVSHLQKAFHPMLSTPLAPMARQERIVHRVEKLFLQN